MDGVTTRTGALGESQALAPLAAALRADLDLPDRRVPPQASGWRAFLILALIALETDLARDTLALNWKCDAKAVDALFEGFAAMGFVTGLGSRALAPSTSGYLAIISYLLDVGRLGPASDAIPLQQNLA